MIGNSALTLKDHTKFLGVIIDNNLSWKQHIQYITNKINSLCSILFHTRRKLTMNALKSIYYSLIHSHISYCSLIWGGTSTDRKEPLNKAHKRVIRTIVGLRKYDHTNDSYKNLELLKLNDCINLRIANFVFDSIIDNSNNMFQSRENLRFPMRNSALLQIPFMRTIQSQTDIRYQGPQVWNSIPASIRSKPTKASFKRALRKLFLSHY